MWKKMSQRQWFRLCSTLWVLGKNSELIDIVSSIWALVVYLMANTTFLDAPERQNLKEQISPYNTVTLTILSKILQITCTPASSELTNNCHIPLATTRGEMRCPVDLWGHLSPALHKGHCLLFAFYCPGDRSVEKSVWDEWVYTLYPWLYIWWPSQYVMMVLCLFIVYWTVGVDKQALIDTTNCVRISTHVVWWIGCHGNILTTIQCFLTCRSELGECRWYHCVR